jgi:hypothetical protein
MKQIILIVILATATTTSARLGDTQEEFEQANPDFKYVGDSQVSEPNTKIRARQYAREGTVAQIVFGADGKVITEAYSDLSGKVPESALVPVAKSYGYDFSALQKVSVSVPWKKLVLQRDFWFSADHKFCIGIGDVVMNDAQAVSTMTVYGGQTAPNIYQNSTEGGGEEPWWKMPGMMNIFKFILLLLVLGFVFKWIYPLLIAPLMGLVMLPFRKNPEKPSAWAWLVMAIVFAGNAYVLWGWAAYIAHLSHSWSAAPEVTQHWLYFVIGFFGCVGPLASMGAGETNIGTAIHFNLTSIAFIVFCIWPIAATTLYGWLPALFGR